MSEALLGSPDDLNVDELPKPCEYQQTLFKSFTLAGVGLHTGNTVTVRVRPAYAGEGRYFVRVPEGATSSAPGLVPGPQAEPADEPAQQQQQQPPTSSGMESEGSEEPPAEGDVDVTVDIPLEDLQRLFFHQYLQVQEKTGFDGTFLEYLDVVREENLGMGAAAQRVAKAVLASVVRSEWLLDIPEPITARGPDEETWTAGIESVPAPGVISPEVLAQCQVLGSGVAEQDAQEGAGLVLGAELLLATLETCGVDNARIELDGGLELPALDGSALSWAIEVQMARLRPAPVSDAVAAHMRTVAAEAGVPLTEPPSLGRAWAEAEGEGEADEGQEEELGATRRLALRVPGPIAVREGDAFISLVPEDAMRLTVGVDHSLNAPAIGKQWVSWCMHEDTHFRFDLAGARRHVDSPAHLAALQAEGFMQGANEGCVIVANGDGYVNAKMIRHIGDEAARYAMLDLLGFLALNSFAGNCGLPIGHVVAYKPTRTLCVQFVQALRAATTEEDWVRIEDAEDTELEEMEEMEEEPEQGGKKAAAKGKGNKGAKGKKAAKARGQADAEEDEGEENEGEEEDEEE